MSLHLYNTDSTTTTCYTTQIIFRKLSQQTLSFPQRLDNQTDDTLIVYDDKPTEGNDKSNDGRTCRNFQNRWLSLYLWLSFDGNLMFFLLL